MQPRDAARAAGRDTGEIDARHAHRALRSARSYDVWTSDLENLCLVRRFTGDAADDALEQLRTQLLRVHERFYADADADAQWSLEDPDHRPPDVRQILAGTPTNLFDAARAPSTQSTTRHPSPPRSQHTPPSPAQSAASLTKMTPTSTQICTVSGIL